MDISLIELEEDIKKALVGKEDLSYLNKRLKNLCKKRLHTRLNFEGLCRNKCNHKGRLIYREFNGKCYPTHLILSNTTYNIDSNEKVLIVNVEHCKNNLKQGKYKYIKGYFSICGNPKLLPLDYINELINKSNYHNCRCDIDIDTLRVALLKSKINALDVLTKELSELNDYTKLDEEGYKFIANIILLKLEFEISELDLFTKIFNIECEDEIC